MFYSEPKENLEKLGPQDVARLGDERFVQLKQISAFSASFYVLPLFMIFNIADWYYFPNLALEFLSYRVFTVIAIYLLNKVIQKASTQFAVECLCTAFVFVCAAPLYLMLGRIGDSGSAYYAGVTLVMIGMSSGFRFSWPFYFLNYAIVALPMLIVMPLLLGIKSGSFYPLSLLFLLSVGLIQFVSRIFNERLHFREFFSRIELNREILSRDKVIEDKTKEAVNLALLSKQFSPQVVHAIKAGELDINKPVHRAEICVMFVDIVSSTERLLRLDREDVHKILTMFMDDVMSSLLKFDITIDKFMGDGVLAFSNDPIKHDDYVERMLYACIEIRDKINSKQSEYAELWMAEFAVSFGIASGFASVGFYGSDLHLKSYTAIGRPVNLAARLGSAAAAQQILVANDIVSKLSKRNHGRVSTFEFNSIGQLKLKGFEADDLSVYELKADQSMSSATGVIKNNAPVCVNGHGLLFLDTNSDGLYIFKCRACEFTMDNLGSSKKAA